MFGSKSFLAIYLGAGIIANIISVLTRVAPVSLGPAACTYGLTGAMVAFFVVHQKDLGDTAAKGTYSAPFHSV